MIDSFRGRYAFLSNFYRCRFKDHVGTTYRTAEHYYQSRKTFDKRWRNMIINATTPKEAKLLGNRAPLRDDWERRKVDVMRETLILKFMDGRLEDKLLETGERELVEGNWWHDNIWGDCRCERCYDIEGSNLLGKLLMEERERIRDTYT